MGCCAGNPGWVLRQAKREAGEHIWPAEPPRFTPATLLQAQHYQMLVRLSCDCIFFPVSRVGEFSRDLIRQEACHEYAFERRILRLFFDSVSKRLAPSSQTLRSSETA